MVDATGDRAAALVASVPHRLVGAGAQGGMGQQCPHPAAGGVEDRQRHIVGVPPSSGIRERELPLFWNDGRRLENGLITCATCHDPHRNPVEYFLRLDTSESRSDICLGCHRKQEAVKGTKHDLTSFFPAEKNRRGEAASETGPCSACHIVHSGGPGESWGRCL